MKKVIASKDKILHALLCLFSLGVLLKTYEYLTKLEKCDCYNDLIAYRSLKINIDFLKAYQIFEMFLIFMLIIIIFCQNSLKIKAIKNAFSLKYLSTSIILLLTFVTGYLSYNVFLLYSISKEKCECMDKWQKYFLYVQGIMNSVAFMRLMFLFVIVFLLLLSHS